MTTKTDITLPPLPRHMDSVTAEEFSRRVLAWGRAAVEADRERRVPSDIDLIAECVLTALRADDHGDLLRASDHGPLSSIKRALLSRYSSGQPAASAEPADPAMSYEHVLSELIDKIVPGLDSGDILRDARQASAALCLRDPVAQEPPLTPDEARWAARNAELMNGPSDRAQPAHYAMAGALAYAAKLAAPVAQEPVGLLDAIDGLMDFAPSCAAGGPGMVRGGDYIKKSEVLRVIKSCAAPVAQEPVAEIYRAHYGNRMGNIGVNAVRALVAPDDMPPPGTKLYAAPVAAQAQPVVNQQMTTGAQDREDAQ